jgi:hypothetical protein
MEQELEQIAIEAGPEVSILLLQSSQYPIGFQFIL